MALLLAGCTSDELQQDSNDPVAVDLAFAVTSSSKASTRMSSAIVQDDGQPYRGLTMRRIVPFDVAGKIGVNDMPKAFHISSTGEKLVDERPYYYYEKCSIVSGVKSFLSYGRATIASESKAVNGSIVETFPASMAPKEIRFSLESISQKVEHTTANSLAHYMSQIANATGNGKKWKEAPSGTLKIIYQNFLNQTGTASDGEILPGSSDNIKAMTQALKAILQNLSLDNEDDIAIRTAIIDKIDAYNTAWDNFPASIGLPDGAAVIRWNGHDERFEPQLSNTELADINGIDRFAYPAEIYYYGNSRIKTSNIDNRKTAYTDTDWTNVLAQYEYEDATVTNNTTAVAIKEPLQYGIARLQVKLKMLDVSQLKDAKNQDVAVGTTNFPLTGIIVGGQLPVGYDFAPTTSYSVYSEADIKFIYDPLVKTNGAESNEYFYLDYNNHAAKVTNTLVLQTYDHKKVPVILEFINNSDKDFTGVDGIVYRGTKFYLVGEVDPDDFAEDPRTDIRDRVFTQDYTTTLNMKVTGLAKAYNVVPNLLSPRLELGIQLVPKWTSTTPEEIVL